MFANVSTVLSQCWCLSLQYLQFPLTPNKTILHKVHKNERPDRFAIESLVPGIAECPQTENRQLQIWQDIATALHVQLQGTCGNSRPIGLLPQSISQSPAEHCAQTAAVGLAQTPNALSTPTEHKNERPDPEGRTARARAPCADKSIDLEAYSQQIAVKIPL